MTERIICNDAGGELREEVVRCRDCAYFASDEIGSYCTLMDFEDAIGDMADGFCSLGKRREEPMSDNTVELVEVVRLTVVVQENGIVRDERGLVVGRADDDWMRYRWKLLESGHCPCCGREDA